jgi:hypothetical protein
MFSMLEVTIRESTVMKKKTVDYLKIPAGAEQDLKFNFSIR